MRSCDGKYFPLMRGNASPVQMCQAFCPASATKVFFGSSIDGASSATGERYADSENAFAYRKALRADCTCNGRDPAGLAPVDLTLDSSLRSGDVIATTSGLVAYTGVRLGANQTAEFTPVASYPGLTADVRARLGEMKVAPVTRGNGRRQRAAAGTAPRRRAARDLGAEDGFDQRQARGSELSRHSLMVRSATLCARLEPSGMPVPLILRDGAHAPPQDEAEREIHRPTMTPITFGADRYFSSISARAAARFSGVSRPRFSARIIQQ